MEPEQSFDPLLAGVADTRREWGQLPVGVRASIETRLGRAVVEATSQPGGFSPALASRLTLADGSGVFVKAIAPDHVSGAPSGQKFYRREARIAGALPSGIPAPRLLAAIEPDGWVALIFEEIAGSPPQLPWRPHELDRVLDAMTGLSDALTPSPLDAPKAAAPGGVNGWAALLGALGPLQILSELDPWARSHLDLLAEVASSADGALAGSTLLHTDIRADNVLLTEERVVFVDWPHATVAAAWADLLDFLPSVAMQGGGDPQTAFWRHPVAREADPGAVRCLLAGLAGYFIHGAGQEPPPGLPSLRRFQYAQGVEALSWLRRMV